MRKILSEEHKSRIQAAALKRRHTLETKKKISESMIGNKTARKKEVSHE